MKILVTGAGGNVGTNLCSDLKKKHQVVTVGRGSEEPCDYGVDLSTNPKAELAKIFEAEKPEAVVHLAAILGGVCETDPDLAHRINVDGTRILAELSAKHGVKTFVFFSTAAVYKQKELGATDENSNIDPQNVYGKTKLEAEAELDKIAQTAANTRFVTLRPFNIYGPGFDRSFVTFLALSTEENPATLFGYDNMHRDYIHITDIVKAVGLVLDHSFDDPHTIINIGSGVDTSNASLIKQLEAAGIKPVYTRAETDAMSISWADISRAKEMLGFQPTTHIITEGLPRAEQT